MRPIFATISSFALVPKLSLGTSGRDQQADERVALVPKLHLGTPLPTKLSFVQSPRHAQPVSRVGTPGAALRHLYHRRMAPRFSRAKRGARSSSMRSPIAALTKA